MKRGKEAIRKRPIIFTGPMVRAILEGRKTQTRRVIKDQPPPTMTDCVCYLNNDRWCFTGPQRDAESNPLPSEQWEGGWPDCGPDFRCPYGVPGERLWVREGVITHASIPQVVGYVADGCKRTEEWEKFRSSRFMPRWASRITLEIAEVRVQRLRDIGEEDAKEEGAIFHDGYAVGHSGYRHDIDSGYVYVDARTSFANFWDSLNAKRGYGWESNPWVWAITFRRTVP